MRAWDLGLSEACAPVMELPPPAAAAKDTPALDRNPAMVLIEPAVAPAPATVVWNCAQNDKCPVVAQVLVTVRSAMGTPLPAVFWPIASHWNWMFSMVAVEAVVV